MERKYAGVIMSFADASAMQELMWCLLARCYLLSLRCLNLRVPFVLIYLRVKSVRRKLIEVAAKCLFGYGQRISR